MKKTASFITALCCLALLLGGCTAKPEEAADTSPSTDAVSPEVTPSPTPSPSPSPVPTPEPVSQEEQIAKQEQLAYSEGTLSARLSAVYALIELGAESAPDAAYTVLSSIYYSSSAFWEAAILSGNRILVNVEILGDILPYLAEAGYGTASEETAAKLSAAVGSAYLEDNYSYSLMEASLGANPALYEALMPALVIADWFRYGGVDGERCDVLSTIYYIGNITNSYFSSAANMDERLARYCFVSQNITPVIAANYEAEEYYSTEYWTDYCELDTLDFTGYMPALTDTPAAKADAPKYLIVCRATGSNDDYDWRIDSNLQALLKPEYAPTSLAEVTAIIAVDTTWQYAFTYDASTIDAYDAVSKISVYDFVSGGLVTSLGTVTTDASTFYTYWGEPPEAVYWNPDIAVLFTGMRSLFNG